MSEKITSVRALWEKAGLLIGSRISDYARGGWFDRAGKPRCCAARIIDGCVVLIIGPITSANRVGKAIGFDPIKPKDKPFWERDDEIK